MHRFHYKGKELYCEALSIRTLAEKVGTPFYLYSAETLQNHFRVLDSAFKGVPHLLAFAVKANANLSVLRLFAKEGGGADIVSSGELFRATKAGIPPSRIVFAGVGKSRQEIADGLRAGILMFNVESPQELLQIHEVAKAEGKRAPVGLRVNPNINPKTHPYISTGLKKNKFGIAIEQAVEEYRLAKRLDHIDIVGVHCHIGSQLTEVQPFVDALKKVLKLVRVLKKEGISIQYLDLGGGLGITYQDETPPKPKELAKQILPLLRDEPYTLILEPGRVLAGNAGILVTKVLYLKEGPKKRFAIVDAAMNDLIRPTLYEAFHEVLPVVKTRTKPLTVDVVGPICETGDFLAQNRKINAYKPGDLLAVMSAGAYGFTMSSNYNARPRVAEVLVKGDQYYIIRQRETFEDLIRGETIPDFLK